MPKIKHQLEIHNNVMDKQDELHKKSTIYSTKKIEELANAILEGGKPDTTPFFHGQAEWKEHGIIFEYTDEELAELDKCASDCSYFVENYCKFLNSKGRTLVKLRDYQTRILKVMSAEKWEPKSETIVPEHPQIVLMQSRQTSKCLSMNTYISVRRSDAESILKVNKKKYKVTSRISDKKGFCDIPLYEIFFSKIMKPSNLDILLYHLYRINGFSIGLLDKQIFKLEQKYKYWIYADGCKLIETYDCNFKIQSAGQVNKCVSIHRTIPFNVYELKFEDGSKLSCADNHLLFADVNQGSQDWTYACDIKKGDFVYSDKGWLKVLNIKKKDYQMFMCDLSLENEE